MRKATCVLLPRGSKTCRRLEHNSVWPLSAAAAPWTASSTAPSVTSGGRWRSGGTTTRCLLTSGEPRALPGPVAGRASAPPAAAEAPAGCLRCLSSIPACVEGGRSKGGGLQGPGSGRPSVSAWRVAVGPHRLPIVLPAPIARPQLSCRRPAACRQRGKRRGQCPARAVLRERTPHAPGRRPAATSSSRSSRSVERHNGEPAAACGPAPRSSRSQLTSGQVRGRPGAPGRLCIAIQPQCARPRPAAVDGPAAAAAARRSPPPAACRLRSPSVRRRPVHLPPQLVQRAGRRRGGVHCGGY